MLASGRYAHASLSIYSNARLVESIPSFGITTPYREAIFPFMSLQNSWIVPIQTGKEVTMFT